MITPRTVVITVGFIGYIVTVILVVTVIVLLRFKKLTEPLVILAAAIVGLILFPIVE